MERKEMVELRAKKKEMKMKMETEKKRTSARRNEDGLHISIPTNKKSHPSHKNPLPASASLAQGLIT